MTNAIEPCLRNALDHAKPLYILPYEPVITEALIPAFCSANDVDMMMGYFCSSSFIGIAPGLASFLRKSKSPMRIIISPFLGPSDFDVLSRDLKELSIIAQKIFLNDIPDEDCLVRHTLECLAWLLVNERLIIKIAVMRNALFHPKVWLFQDDSGVAAVHGSTNFTGAGLMRNREQLTLSRNWKGEESKFHITRLRQEFDELWSGGDAECAVLPLPQAISNKLLEKHLTDRMPTEDSFKEMWNKINPPGSVEFGEKNSMQSLRIPAFLEYETGAFKHQGEAVRAWESTGGKGILEMATGAGKTITSMVCATRLVDRIGKALIIVSAPYKPLIDQWCVEIREFGVTPINTSVTYGAKGRDREIKQAYRRLRKDCSSAEVLVVSNDILKTPEFISSLSECECSKLLIADECHNLGTQSFICNPPDIFDYRIGLSATPVRQYDEPGTEQLFNYFGQVCYAFTLEQAIGVCLTPYDYFVVFVELTKSEQTEWRELTRKISALSWKFATTTIDDPYLSDLLRKRRKIIETARDKITLLSNLLNEYDKHKLKHTLIYASDKEPNQLIAVNQLLMENGITFHQLTQEETKDNTTTRKIISDFQSKNLQVITAKRVLDEGVNIPQIETAFILASTTVKRQWIQRRGRLLRTCKATGKRKAKIYDFVVIPPDITLNPDVIDSDMRNLVRSELDRVWEFARLADNAAERNGPYKDVKYLQEITNGLI